MAAGLFEFYIPVPNSGMDTTNLSCCVYVPHRTCCTWLGSLWLKMTSKCESCSHCSYWNLCWYCRFSSTLSAMAQYHGVRVDIPRRDAKDMGRSFLWGWVCSSECSVFVLWMPKWWSAFIQTLGWDCSLSWRYLWLSLTWVKNSDAPSLNLQIVSSCASFHIWKLSRAVVYETVQASNLIFKLWEERYEAVLVETDCAIFECKKYVLAGC